jgi:hypothetical protein
MVIRTSFLLGVLLGVGMACSPASVSPVRLNEVMPSNDSGCRDELGERNDWVELFNTADVAVDLGGYSLTDDTELPNLSVLPNGLVIAGHGALLFWADETPALGQSHLGFRLKASGGQVVLYDSETREADRFRWSAALPDISFARLPDGTGDFTSCSAFTCGSTNPSTCGS